MERLITVRYLSGPGRNDTKKLAQLLSTIVFEQWASKVVQWVKTLFMPA